MDRICTVTGAFGYSGKYVAERLLARGDAVRTLTKSPARHDPFGGRLRVDPLAFDAPDTLARALEGVDVLVNTYWVRFNHAGFTFADAVANTRILFDAARRAKVGRIVHVSITRPDKASRLEYFRGKAELEEALMETGVPYSILRPAVLFGGEDILINNIAWVLRRMPLFGVFGDGNYRMNPIHIADFADLVVRHTVESGNHMVEAVGPDNFTYRELVEVIAEAIGVRRTIVSVPPIVGYAVGRVLGWMLRDEVVTWDEVHGLMEGRLDVWGPAQGATRISDFARMNAKTLGLHYASELRRRRDRCAAY